MKRPELKDAKKEYWMEFEEKIDLILEKILQILQKQREMKYDTKMK